MITPDNDQVIQDLRKSLAWLDLVLATLNEGVIVLDGNMKVLFANDAIADMLEKPRILLLGSSVWKIAKLYNAEGEVLPQKRFSEARHKNVVGSLSGIYSLKTPSGTVSVELSAAHIATTQHTVLVVRDVTEHIQAEAQRLKIAQEKAGRKAAEISERRMLMQYEVASVLAGSFDLEETICRILSLICRSLEWNAGILWTVNKKSSKLQFVSYWTDNSPSLSEFIKVSQQQVFSKGQGLPGSAWEKGKPIWKNDVSKETNFPRREVARRSNLHGAFAIPLYDGKDFVGVMEFFSELIQKPDLELLTSMATVGMQIAEYMRRKSIEKMTISLREQSARLLELNNAKDEFISLASHQLRTPATGVKQFLGMLVEGYGGKLSQTQKKFAEKAYESNERQITIINDLLKVAQIDAGKVVLKKEKTELTSLIMSILEEQNDKFVERRQKVNFTKTIKILEPPLDVKHFRMAVENIIDNASKYTEPDKNIAITVSACKSSAIISIKDQGVGIAEDDIDKIFNKFTRVDNPLSTVVGGSGLGLYWCKKIIELHDGDISVKSSLGNGTTFTISVPIA